MCGLYTPGGGYLGKSGQTCGAEEVRNRPGTIFRLARRATKRGCAAAGITSPRIGCCNIWLVVAKNEKIFKMLSKNIHNFSNFNVSQSVCN